MKWKTLAVMPDLADISLLLNYDTMAVVVWRFVETVNECRKFCGKIFARDLVIPLPASQQDRCPQQIA
jgi:hypothetical protein